MLAKALTLERLPLFFAAAARLMDINAGRRKIRPRGHPYESWDNVYAGDVHYVDDDGWVYVIFNDCGSFDYIDSIHAPGESEPLDFSELTAPPVVHPVVGDVMVNVSLIVYTLLEPNKEQLKYWGLTEDCYELPGWWH